MKINTTIFGLIALSIMSCISYANEAALYAENAPPGSAFIRVFNGYTGKTINNASLGGKIVKQISPLKASPYVFLPAGSHGIEVSGKQRNISMNEGEFYTLVIGNDFEPAVIEDTAFNNRRKALIGLYNLISQAPIDLKTAKGDIAIIEDVNYMESKTREINPVHIPVSVTGNSVLGKTESVNLERGKVFSVFACGDQSAPKLVFVESQIDTTL